MTFLKISSSSLPLKGGYPESMIKRITPIDHTSHFSISGYFKITSGAT
jgi:hypothetical protein